MIVLSLCAIQRRVFCLKCFLIVSWIFESVSKSTDAVA
jgi:hypothetical protein